MNANIKKKLKEWGYTVRGSVVSRGRAKGRVNADGVANEDAPAMIRRALQAASRPQTSTARGISAFTEYWSESKEDHVLFGCPICNFKVKVPRVKGVDSNAAVFAQGKSAVFQHHKEKHAE